MQDKYENLKVQLLKQKEYSDHVHLEYQKLEAQLEQRTGEQAEGILGSCPHGVSEAGGSARTAYRLASRRNSRIMSPPGVSKAGGSARTAYR